MEIKRKIEFYIFYFMDQTKEDIRKILLMHENPEKVLTDYVYARVRDIWDSRFISGFISGVLTVLVLFIIFLYIKLP